jgi:gamma-glutamyl-gamma-aminobutyrate hydrolase PuuD
MIQVKYPYSLLHRVSLLLLFSLIVNVGYVQSQIHIAISKTSKHYEDWLRSADTSIILVSLYSMKIDSALTLLSSCNGLLLTGGEDVDPVNYGKVNEIGKCEEIDRYRDSLEFALIKKSISKGIPIFGICRGEQILNVALGGTLYTDIPTDIGKTILHRCPESSKECLHTISIKDMSLLALITGQKSGMVNSYHHQAVEKTGPGMRIVATSENGVVEAIESDNTIFKSFVMGVQWHPERLIQNPLLSKPLVNYFLEETRKFKPH